MEEIWKKYVHIYEVSNYGRLRNMKTGKIRKPVCDKYGYIKIDVTLGDKSSHKRFQYIEQ